MSIKFLTCEPNLNNVKDYKDEADLFFENIPDWFLKNKIMVNEASFIITFQSLYDNFKTELADFKICKKFFYSFFQQSNRTDKYMLLLCPKHYESESVFPKIKTDL